MKRDINWEAKARHAEALARAGVRPDFHLQIAKLSRRYAAQQRKEPQP